MLTGDPVLTGSYGKAKKAKPGRPEKGPGFGATQ
jgi:hypothetical protein